MIAIIPARSGSKGVPDKNIRDLNGIPLITYTIRAAIESNCFTDVVVTTDGEAISEISINCGAKVIRRPSFLAQDDTLMADAIRHVYSYKEVLNLSSKDFFCLLQPTSPLRDSSHVIECVTKFKISSFKSALSVCENTYTPFKSLRLVEDHLEPLFDLSLLNVNRQALEKTYRQNGAIYITNWDSFLTTNSFIEFPAMPYFMTEAESIDIDSLKDFQCAENIIIKKS